MKLGDLIKDLRLNKEISQEKVANKIGISRSVLSQYENNLVEPTAFVVKKFAEFFEVSSDYLLGLENDFGERVSAPMGDGLSSEERKLLTVFRSLSPDMRDTLWSLLATWTPTESLKPLKK